MLNYLSISGLSTLHLTNLQTSMLLASHKHTHNHALCIPQTLGLEQTIKYSTQDKVELTHIIGCIKSNICFYLRNIVEIKFPFLAH